MPSWRTSSPFCGRAPELAEDEAGDRVVVLLRQVGLELLVEVVDRERAVDPDVALVDALDRLVREVVLVLDLAHDLLEQVFERDDPLEGAVLVDDERHVLVLAPELRKHRREVLRLRDDMGRANELLDDDVVDPAVVKGPEEVAHVQEADDVVKRPPVDRVTRERRVDHRGEALVGREVDRERHDLGPRHHHLVDLLVREVEDLVEHRLFFLVDDAGVLGGRDHHPNLVLVRDDDPCRGRRDAEEARERVRGFLQEPHDRIRADVERLDRERDPERRVLVLRERDGFRHELAEDDVQVRDDREREDEGDRRRERGVEEVLDERLADRTEGDREGGDSELDRADEAHGIVHDPKSDPCPSAPLGGELRQTRAPGRYERVLGRNEERVPRDEQENGEDLEENGHAPLPGAWVLGGISSNF